MKKQIRKMTNRTAGYIFFYNLIMIAVMFGAIVIMTIAAMAGAGAEQAADRAVDAPWTEHGRSSGDAEHCGGVRRTSLSRDSQLQDRASAGAVPKGQKDGCRALFQDFLRLDGLPDDLLLWRPSWRSWPSTPSG